MSVTQRPTLISLIVAMAQNGVIGRGNALPWRLPEDLKRFREYTLGKPILMGRKTFESIGRPLPGRLNLVLTRDPHWHGEGVTAVHSVEEALQRTRDSEELVAIGGAEIYRLLLPLARRIYLTHVHADVAGDAFFPAFDPAQWDDVDYRVHPADERHAYPVTFVTLERRTGPAPPRPH
ncbi:MAG TPA: type 3 dihydrofolate reductase [Candidatus Dormibacteraeota bacterium]|nr:type 3 dihydrofolate reductase [Candidatus Dormibacteraeota bacterium]